FSFMRDNLSLKILIVGDGPEYDRLRQYAQARHLDERIIFTGILSDVTSAYQAMDIFVLPSLTEGVPLTVLEAMASHRPVVASNVGGVSQLIENDKTGFLIDVNRLDSLLKPRIEELIENVEKRKVLSDKAYAFVLKKYSLNTMCELYSNIYKENLNL
ncbi:glycosyltransferase, partial [Candidatus Omnitrophota bacterium]